MYDVPITLPRDTWRPATEETPLVRRLLIGSVLLILALLLFAPLVTVFYEALRKGWWEPVSSLGDPEGLAAIRLTLTVAVIAVPLNAIFGVAAAFASS